MSELTIPASAHISTLSNLPLFHKLQGRRTVVLGNSEAADWKAELLSAAGAEVVRLDSHWTPEQLKNAALAIADLTNVAEVQRFAETARASGANVNIIDRPDLSDVMFGTIVNRSPIVIGISTDGAAPVLGQSIRAKIEGVLPVGLSSWAAAAKVWRRRLKVFLTETRARRRFWERFVELAWLEPDRAIIESDFDAILGGTGGTKGRVTLVGAGPGDPELLTLKAVRSLQTATVILYDQLVGPGILELARREARLIPVGKIGHGPSCSQSAINELMVDLARAGGNVVRLKGGDPLIFGRAAEEIHACRTANIDVSVIPGISAAQGAASSLLISLTERRHARRVQFVTGHAANGKLPTDIDWRSVADRKATTVLYMPRRTLDEFIRTALFKGLDAETPSLAIAAATLPEEAYVAGTVVEIGALAEQLPAGAPLTVLIGWVARSHVAPRVTSFPLQLATSARVAQ